MKARMDLRDTGDGRACVFSIPEKPEAGEFVAPVRNFSSGKLIQEAAQRWAASHGASVEP